MFKYTTFHYINVIYIEFMPQASQSMYSVRNSLSHETLIYFYSNVMIGSSNVVACIINIVLFIFIRNISFLFEIFIVIFKSSNFYFFWVPLV